MSPELEREISLELESLHGHFKVFDGLISELSTRSPNRLEIMALGGFLNAFYNGIENILKRILRHLDIDIPQSDRWHSELLKAFENGSNSGFPSFKADLIIKLKDYMAFRHLFRHSYAQSLSWEKMASLVRESHGLLKQLLEQIGYPGK